MLKKLTVLALPLVLAACASSDMYHATPSDVAASIGRSLTVRSAVGSRIELAFDRSVTPAHRAAAEARVRRAVELVEVTFKPQDDYARPLKLVFTNGRAYTRDSSNPNEVVVYDHVESPLAEFIINEAVFRHRVNPASIEPWSKTTTIATQYSVLAGWAGVHLMSTDLRRHELVSRLYLDHVALSDGNPRTTAYISRLPLPPRFSDKGTGAFNTTAEALTDDKVLYQRYVLSPMVALGIDALMRELAPNPQAEPLLITLYRDAMSKKMDLLGAFDARVKDKTKQQLLRQWLHGRTIDEGFVFRGLNRNDDRILVTLMRPVLVDGPLGKAETFLWKENPSQPNKKRVFLVTHKTFSQSLPVPQRMDRYYRRLLVELLPHGDVLVVHRPHIGGAKGAEEHYGPCSNPDYRSATKVAGTYVMAATKYLQSLGYNHIVGLGEAAGALAVVDGARNGVMEQVFTFNAGRGILSPDNRCRDTESMQVMVEARQHLAVPVIHMASNQDARYQTAERRKLLEASGDETLWYDMPPYTDGHYMMWFHTDLWVDDLISRLRPLD